MMTFPRTSQLEISDRIGRKTGDHLCGPLAFYAMLKGRGQMPMSFNRFLKTYLPNLSLKNPMTFQDALHQLRESGALHEEDKHEIHTLERPDRKTPFCQSVHELLQIALTRGPCLLQIGAYHAEIKNKKNKWQRGLGHFVVLFEAGKVAGGAIDPFFQIQYWDPWDGEIHSAVVYEELYRDFTGLDFRAGGDLMNKAGYRTSPTGHRVLSPYLCLLAPHLDLYDPKVYFAQRYNYLLEQLFV